MHLSPCSLGCWPSLGRVSVIVDSLFIVAPIVYVGSIFGLCFVIQSTFAIILTGKRKLDAFPLIVFLMSCDCKCSEALPHGTVGWSSLCECGISWSYLLVLLSLSICHSYLQEFQRREDGTVNFEVGWDSYRDGFGSPAGEHWLGMWVVCLFVLFVWFDSLRPINNLSVKQGRVFLGWTNTKLG